MSAVAAWLRRLPSASGALPGWAWCALVYLVSRLAVLAGVVAYRSGEPGADLARLVDRWDGWWYVRIAAGGYSSSLHPPLGSVTDWHHNFSHWAFFPGYPLAVRAVGLLPGVGFPLAAVVVSLGCGFLAVWAVHQLGLATAGPEAARGATLLFAAWPGAAVFGQPYSEALFLAAAGASLTLLVRERWWAAGALGAVATLTRPTGVALLVAAATVAGRRLLRDRDPRPLAAPALTSLGLLAFVGYGWWRTGDPMVWRHAENLWSQRLDLGARLVSVWADTLGHAGRLWRTTPGRAGVISTVVDLLCLVALVVLGVAARVRRRRVDLPSAVYAAACLAMILGSSGVGPRPRALLVLLPGFVWVAAWWPRRVVVAVAVAMLPMSALLTWFWLWRVVP